MLETVNTLNEAFCDVHRRHCPAASDSQGAREMARACARAAAASDEVRRDLMRIDDVPAGEPGALCANQASDTECTDWAATGQCDSNAGAPAGARKAARKAAAASAALIERALCMSAARAAAACSQADGGEPRDADAPAGFMSAGCAMACALCYPALSPTWRNATAAAAGVPVARDATRSTDARTGPGADRPLQPDSRIDRHPNVTGMSLLTPASRDAGALQSHDAHDGVHGRDNAEQGRAADLGDAAHVVTADAGRASGHAASTVIHALVCCSSPPCTCRLTLRMRRHVQRCLPPGALCISPWLSLVAISLGTSAPSVRRDAERRRPLSQRHAPGAFGGRPAGPQR